MEQQRPNPFPDWLRRRAFSNPERLAVISGDQRFTFAELDRRVDEVARWLAGHGISVGQHVALLLRNSVEFVELVHAISRLGAITVPLNLRLTPSEITWQLHDVGACLLITDGPSSDLRSSVERECPGVQIVEPGQQTNTISHQEAITSRELREYHAPDDIHSIVYTSGTTGRPKGALLSYGNHWWSAIGSALNLGTQPDDRWMAVLPLFHVGGLSILMRSVIYGITVIVHESFDPEAVNQSIEQDRVTIISVVSTMLRRMLEAQGNVPYPPWLRCVLLGGGPAPRPLLEACADRDIPVTQTYGLTESASQIATLSPEDALRKLGSAGKPLYPNELAIDTGSRYGTPDEPGEILVRGPIITVGYHERPDATAEALRGGWFHTGDAGFLDDEGYLFVLDRRDDLIVTGGENVYPAEIEAVLSGHPNIVEAGVIGVPDEEWGQRVVAQVTVNGDHDLEPGHLQDWCRAYLAGYKIPVEFQFQAEPLPRNAGGKLLRRQIREEWSDEKGAKRINQIEDSPE